MTRTVQKWNREEKDRAKLEEEAMIFSDFDFQDEGRSRQLVCSINQNHKYFEINRALIEYAPLMLEQLKACKKVYEESTGSLIAKEHLHLFKKVEKTINYIEDEKQKGSV